RWRSAGGRPRPRACPPARSAAARPSSRARGSATTPARNRRSSRSVASQDVLPRADAVATLASEPFDVLVIGGGITGAGVALDAATRGYSVALVERGDYAIGTSSRSSKLVHGGLRYLQNFDLGLVREALLERQLNVALAPHLVKPLPLVVPALGGERKNRAIGIGLNMYDVMATSRIGRGRSQRNEHREEAEYWSPDRHRTISGEEAAELIPALEPMDPSSAYLF